VSWDGKLVTLSNVYGSPSPASVSLNVASGAPQIIMDVQTPVLWWMGSSPSESVDQEALPSPRAGEAEMFPNCHICVWRARLD
jgi:hypothetical protein